MIRKNIMELSSEELESFAKALNQLFRENVIKDNAELHKNNFTIGIHWGPTFLPWHRDFLRKFEIRLQDINPNISLPYWDWTQENSRDLDIGIWSDFFGGRNNIGGKFKNWSYTRNNANSPILEAFPLPRMDTLLNELNKDSFTLFRALEAGSHVSPHVWVGGSMAGGESPLDPLFYLHHCNIDRLWSIWQLNNSDIEQYNHEDEASSDRGNVSGTRRSINEQMRKAEIPIEELETMYEGETPASMLDHTTLGYLYKRDEELEERWFSHNGTSLITNVEPRYKFEASILHPNGKAYFFTINKYQRYDFTKDKLDKIANIGTDGWSGLWNNGLDATVMHPNGKAYFFKDDMYQRFNFETDSIDKEARINIDGWQGLWTEGMDGAILHPNGKAYFFKGDKYQRFDFDKDKVDKVADIGIDGWKGLESVEIDSIINHPNGKAYFFTKNKYYRFDFTLDMVDKVGKINKDGWWGLHAL